MPRIKDFAIVLRESDWSETSQVVTLLSLDHGKFRGLAKGSRRQSPSSVARFSGGIEPLTRGQVVASLKPRTGLATITEWDLQDPYPHLRQDLATMHVALFAVDLASAMLADHEPHPTAFHALETLLSQLVQSSQRETSLLAYQWAMLQGCGFQPRLDLAEQAVPEGGAYWFDPTAGGLIPEPDVTPQGQGNPDQGPWRVRGETVTLLRGLADNQPVSSDTDKQWLQRANRLLCAYARHVLERELPTMGQILREEPGHGS